MVAPTMDEFTFLSVQHWNKLEHFFQALVVQLSEQLNSGHMEHQDLFRKLAYVEVQVAGFRKLLFQNYRLFNMDEKISPAKLGLVLYSDRVRYDNETISSHRVLLCDRAVVCVKFHFVRVGATVCSVFYFEAALKHFTLFNASHYRNLDAKRKSTPGLLLSTVSGAMDRRCPTCGLAKSPRCA